LFVLSLGAGGSFGGVLAFLYADLIVLPLLAASLFYLNRRHPMAHHHHHSA
jgi:hypothetical protein